MANRVEPNVVSKMLVDDCALRELLEEVERRFQFTNGADFVPDVLLHRINHHITKALQQEHRPLKEPKK